MSQVDGWRLMKSLRHAARRGGPGMTMLRVPVRRPRRRTGLVPEVAPRIARQLTENWPKVAVPVLPAWAVENMPASRVLFAPVGVAVPTVVQVVPLAE